MKAEMNKPILREAETKDMKSVIILVEKLIAAEMKVSDIPVIEDEGERKRIVTETIARALVDLDQNVWVVEKSGRLLGVFIAAKEIREGLESRNPKCVFTHAYNQKTVLPFQVIHNRVREWAKEKGCKSIEMTALEGNEEIQKLVESLGYKKKMIIFELEV